MNKTEILGGTLAAMMLLSGCKAANETNRTPAAETAVLPASAIKVELIAEMSVDQENALNGLKGLEYKNALKRYAEYWEKVKLIGPGVTVGLGVMPNMKDVTDFSSMLFYFELPGQDYVGKKCTLPWAQYQKYLATGDYQQLLPPDSDELLTNTDPFCLSSEVTENSAAATAGIPLGSLLANLDGQPVYIDPVTKEVVGILDAESIKWQAKESFTAEKLAFVPHSVEEIGQSVEVRSPIDDPEGYKEDIQKVLDVIHTQILPNYSGEFVNNKTLSIDNTQQLIYFNGGTNLTPVTSMYFNWTDSNGNVYKVPHYFFPAEDSEGKFTISITFDPVRIRPNGPAFENNPAPDWHMSALLSKFPMQIVGRGYFQASYSSGPYNDEFYKAYYKNNDIKNESGNSELGQAYWDFITKGKSFNRGCEKQSLIGVGGQ